MPFTKGKILIASPALVDPSFVRTVVLIAEHTTDGAMGLVVNRPSDAFVAESVDELGDLVDAGDSVFVGGPVSTDSVMVLAEFDEPEHAAALVFADVGFLAAEADLSELSGRTRRARVFAGHSGWGAGQLERELEEGAWIVTEPDADEIFAEDPEEAWASALARMGGAYALLARVPQDPSVN